MSKRPIHKYPEIQLEEAMNAIRRGMKIREASRKYGVPRGTLQDRIHGRVPEGSRKMGPKTILTKEEETAIATWSIKLAKCGFPLKIDDLLNTVQQILKDDQRTTPFKNGRPGKKWYNAFLKRNPQLSHRTPEALSKGRAIVTEEFIKKWFDDLASYLSKNGFKDILQDPSRIFNGDETSFVLCPKTGKVIAPRGYKNVYQIQNGKEKEAVTVLLFFSATGQTLPPCVVFPYIRPPKDVVNSMPKDWFLGKSDTGWMKAEIFFDYISKGMDTWLTENSIKRPVLVFVDGHKSHLTMKLSEFCSAQNIILYALPPNTTHLMQPADVSVFKPLKSDWKNTVRQWQMEPENLNSYLTKSTFCPMLNKVLENNNFENTIRNGFRKCGLYPFNPNAVDYSKCIQNELENHQNHQEKAQSLLRTPEGQHVLTLADFIVTEKVLKAIKVQSPEVDITNILKLVQDEKRKLVTEELFENKDDTNLHSETGNLSSNIFIDQSHDMLQLPELNHSAAPENLTILDFPSITESDIINNLSVNTTDNIYTAILETNDSGFLVPVHSESVEWINTNKNENSTVENTIKIVQDNQFRIIENNEEVQKQIEAVECCKVDSKFEASLEVEEVELKPEETNDSKDIRIIKDNGKEIQRQTKAIVNICKGTDSKTEEQASIYEINNNEDIGVFNGREVQKTTEVIPKICKGYENKDKEDVYSCLGNTNEENMNQKIKVISDVIVKYNQSRISPHLKKHLTIPPPITKPLKRSQQINRIGAISSSEWRLFEKEKEEEKQKKKELISKRKEERQKIKEKKEEEIRKRKQKLTEKTAKKRKTIKIKCTCCKENLESDTEENDLKNIGCDLCPAWFHLKCTEFAGHVYEDICNQNFICNKCNT